MLPLVDRLPSTRGAGEIPLLIDIAQETAQSGEAILSAFAPLTAPTTAEAQLSTVGRARIAIVDHGALADAALERLERLQPDLARLEARPWGGVLKRAAGGLTAASGLVEQAIEARSSLAAMREGFDPMFGFDQVTCPRYSYHLQS